MYMSMLRRIISASNATTLMALQLPLLLILPSKDVLNVIMTKLKRKDSIAVYVVKRLWAKQIGIKKWLELTYTLF